MTNKQLQAVVNELAERLNEAPKVNVFSGKPMTAKSPRVSKKDIKTVVEYWVGGSYAEVEQTKLFKQQGGRYCRLLELLNKMNLQRN